MATEREAFEAWIAEGGGDLQTFGIGQHMHYRNGFVNNAWLAWSRRAALAAPPVEQQARELTYSSTQATECAGCGVRKHTPLRIDAMGGYVCLTCISNKLGSMLGEFGHPEPAQPAPQAGAAESYEDLWNALQAIDTAAVNLPGFEVRHEGGIEAVTKNIVEAIQRVAAHPTEQPGQDAEALANYQWLRQNVEYFEAAHCAYDYEDSPLKKAEIPMAFDADVAAARAAQAQGESKGGT